MSDERDSSKEGLSEFTQPRTANHGGSNPTPDLSSRGITSLCASEIHEDIIDGIEGILSCRVVYAGGRGIGPKSAHMKAWVLSVRYGTMHELIFPFKDGHLSIGVELNANPTEVAQSVAKCLELPI
ncbi:MAG: hypothetical protein ACLP5V_10870 [Candidatus Bathyarchaeia archaeon]